MEITRNVFGKSEQNEQWCEATKRLRVMRVNSSFCSLFPKTFLVISIHLAWKKWMEITRNVFGKSEQNEEFTRITLNLFVASHHCVRM
jgi:hypothetical protein